MLFRLAEKKKEIFEMNRDYKSVFISVEHSVICWEACVGVKDSKNRRAAVTKKSMTTHTHTQMLENHTHTWCTHTHTHTGRELKLPMGSNISLFTSHNSTTI